MLEFNKSLVTKTLILILSFLASIGVAQVTITTDDPTASYDVGETIVFTVESTTSGVAEYTIRYSNVSKVLQKGQLNLVAGQQAKVAIKAVEPCFLVCRVALQGNEAVVGVSVSPFDLVPFEPTPSDFDAFWNGVKAELAQVPMDPQLTFLSETPASKTYRINLANIGNRRVYGYISIPTTDGPFAAVLQTPAYGSAPGNANPIPYIAENLGMIAMTISIHNTEPDVQDPNAYLPNDPSTKEGNYYKFALMAAVRSIDYIFSRPDFDGAQLALYGTSQGGGLAVSTAGLDSRVKLLIDLVPALCRHDGLRFGRPSGHPHYIHFSRAGGDNAAKENAITEATKYYDAVNFAKRYHGPSLSVFGYIDKACPPATGFTANNQILNSKMIVHSTKQGHGATFEDPYQWYRFVRGYFTSLDPYEVPFQNSAWYVMKAGDDQTVSVGQVVNLSAVLTDQSSVVTDLPVEWQKVSGPGGVHFATPNSYATTVTFTEAGTYMFRVVAKDQAPLNDTGIWLDIIDYVTITVQ